MSFIDLHCHLLPGIDDGPVTIEDSVALAGAVVHAGISRVAATPHVNRRHHNSAETIESARAELVAALSTTDLDLTIEQGAEISAQVILDLDDPELRRLTLGGGDWLLVEPFEQETGFDTHSVVFEVQRRGFKVLLAHPERIPHLQDDLDLLADLVRGGVRTQVTAESLSGRYGHHAELTAREMFRRNLVHVLATDAHHATDRPPALSKPARRLGPSEMVDWLCRQMPAWILDGGPEPPRPARRGVFERLGLRK